MTSMAMNGVGNSICTMDDVSSLMTSMASDAQEIRYAQGFTHKRARESGTVKLEPKWLRMMIMFMTYMYV